MVEIFGKDESVLQPEQPVPSFNLWANDGFSYPKKLNPSAVEILQGAANNFPITNLINRMRHSEHVPDSALEFDENFNSMEYIKGTPMEAYSHAFIGAASEKDAANIWSWIQHRTLQRQEAAERPWLSFGANAVMMTSDPATWVGAGLISRMNKVYAAAGQRSYMQAGAIFGASQVPGEILRQVVDPSVSKEESSMILGASTLFGMLGGRFTKRTSMEGQVFEEALKRQEAEFMAQRAATRNEFKDPAKGPLATDDLPMFGRRWSRQDELNKAIEDTPAFKEAEAKLKMKFAWPAGQEAVRRTIKLADELGVTNNDIVKYLLAGHKFSGARGKYNLGIINAGIIRKIAKWKNLKAGKSPYGDQWVKKPKVSSKTEEAGPTVTKPKESVNVGPIAAEKARLAQLSKDSTAGLAALKARFKVVDEERFQVGQKLLALEETGVRSGKEYNQLVQRLDELKIEKRKIEADETAHLEKYRELAKVDLDDIKWSELGDDIGAARTPGRPVAGGQAHQPAPALGLEKVNLTPQQRTANSQFSSVGHTAQLLFETPWLTKGMLEGVAAPLSVNQRMRNYLFPIAEAIQEMEKSFLAYRLAAVPESEIGQFFQVAKTSLKDRISGPGHNQLTLGEFKDAVGRTMVTGKKHPVSEVNRMAQWWRDSVYDPIGKDAVALGLIPSHALKKNYFNRIWNHQAIKDSRPEFEDLIAHWLMSSPQARKAIPAKMTPQQAARSITDKMLMDRPFSPFSEFEIGAASPLHKLAIEIPNDYTGRKGMSVMDFMVTDVEVAGRAFSRIMSADIELARSFAPLSDEGLIGLKEGADGVRMETAIGNVLRDGFEDIGLATPKSQNKITKIMDHFLQQREDVLFTGRKDLEAGGDPILIKAQIEKETKALHDSIVKTMGKINQRSGKSTAELFDRTQDLLAMRDLIRGTFGQPNNPSRLASRVMKGGRTFTAFTMLGGPLWSAVPDLAMPVLHEGLMRTWQVSFAHLFGGIDKSLIKLSKKEGRLAGEGWDMNLATRALAIMDYGDLTGRFSALERGLDATNSLAFVLNLFNPWNMLFKDNVGLIIQSRILETTLRQSRGQRVSQRDAQSLLLGSIDQDAGKIIAAQFEKWGRREGKIWIANTEAWDKTAAVQQAVLQFRGALGSDIRRTIITPNKSDLPLWVSTELGGVIAALKTFSFASIQKVAIPALQHKDRQALMGIAMLTAIGALVHELKRKQHGIDRYETIGEKIMAGIERGGVTGPFMDVNKMIEIVSNNQLGLNPLMGAPQIDTSAFQKAGSVAGPVFTQAGRLASIMGDVVSGNIDDSTMNSINRVMPLQAVPVYSGMYDRIFDANRGHQNYTSGYNAQDASSIYEGSQ